MLMVTYLIIAIAAWLVTSSLSQSFCNSTNTAQVLPRERRIMRARFTCFISCIMPPLIAYQKLAQLRFEADLRGIFHFLCREVAQNCIIENQTLVNIRKSLALQQDSLVMCLAVLNPYKLQRTTYHMACIHLLLSEINIS